MKVPNFVVVGAPKAGTSSLYHYLKDHPDVYLPEQKELHYWARKPLSENFSGPGDRLALNDVVTTWEDYCFRYQSSTVEKQMGDVSPSYLYFHDRVIPALKRELPAVKIIIMLRDPVDRAYSNYLHQQRLTYEKLSFSEALESEGDRAAAGYSDFWRYADHSRYFEPCKAYVEAFGVENVHFLTFEELRDEPHRVMAEMFLFLGVDGSYVPANLGKVYNAGGAYKNNFMINFLLRPSWFKSILHKYLGARWIRGYKFLKGKCLSASRTEVEGVEPKVRRKLAATLKGDVARLASNFNVNVKLWRGFDDV